MNIVKSVKRKGYELQISLCDPLNPREDSTIGKMYCWHKRYNIGDKNPYTSPEDMFDDDNFTSEIVKFKKIYAYEHGGITISTQTFNCSWDSGFIGFIIATKSGVAEMLGENATEEQISEMMKNEVKRFDEYMNGEAYEFAIIDLDGMTIEVCSGFDGLLDEGLLNAMSESTSEEYSFLFEAMKEKL